MERASRKMKQTDLVIGNEGFACIHHITRLSSSHIAHVLNKPCFSSGAGQFDDKPTEEEIDEGDTKKEEAHRVNMIRELLNEDIEENANTDEVRNYVSVCVSLSS